MTWLTGWNYRKPITISSGSALTDYQVLITIDTAVLVTAAKLLSSCNDIRFTSSDSLTSLNYWIESDPNTSSTKIWVKIPSILASPSATTIYLYYNNTGASSVSNGTNTFDFFDDFTSDINGWEFWATFNTGSRTLSNDSGAGTMTHTQTGSGYDNSASRGTTNTYKNVAILSRFKSNSGMFGSIYGRGISGTNGGYYYILRPTLTEIRLELKYHPSWTLITNYSKAHSTDVYYTYQLAMYDSTISILDAYNNVLSSGTNSQISSVGYTGTAINSDAGEKTRTGTFDYFAVRKYAFPEPTFSTTGTEEVGITAYSMSLHPSETPCRTGICTVRADVTWQNLGSSSITFRPTIIIDGTTYAYAASDITIEPNPNTGSSSITTPILSVGTHTICPYPN